MLATTKGRDVTVSKTISGPMGVWEQVADEAAIMGCSFSESTIRLLKIAIAVRSDARKSSEMMN